MQITNIITELQDYMFTSNNLNRFTKHIIQINIQPKASLKNIIPDSFFYSDVVSGTNNKSTNHNYDHKQNTNHKLVTLTNKLTDDKLINKINNNKYKEETIYKPKQKDSLFWCFYILKHGYSNYEMEINNQYFTIEKREKFNYIEMLRKNKDLLKIHKIKPFTELEDDLANKDKISVKTFFALCILENINVLLVDKRKIFELTCTDIDNKHPVHVVHRNRKNYEHYIELNVTDNVLKNYRETYYKSSTLDASIKSIGSYKCDELIELCKKLDINISVKQEGKKKLTKKDIYEILVLNY
jgi:hypothetical protein